jgi:molecular chaperone GrpE
LAKLVPVLDHFEMAMAAAQNTDGVTVDALKTGVMMISSQLKSVLADLGLEEIDAAGRPFDPAWHEAVSERESVEAPPGQVVQQLRKGYKFRDRLLRPASVIVARKAAASAPAAAA